MATDRDAQSRRDFREDLTKKIVALVEKGTAPWQKPWNPEQGGAGFEMPHNATTGRAYRGGNAIGLMARGQLMGSTDPRWATYKQATEAGWQVRKGERGTTVEYWQFEREEERSSQATGKAERVTVKLERPRVFYATVFHASQIDGIPAHAPRERPKEWDPIDAAEQVLIRSGATIRHDQVDRAFYRPGTDSIHLPLRATFDKPLDYYEVALHELGHWSGHESRLKRDLSGGFGSASYAREELRAQMASLFMSAELGVPFKTERHAAYNAPWIKVLSEDKNELFKAARDAEQIAEYLLAPARERVADRAITSPIREGVTAVESDQSESKHREPIATATAGERTWLAVPFKEKDAARAAGARWDKEAKAWYAPPETDLAPLAQWLPRDRATPAVPRTPDPRAEFGEALARAGLIVAGLPVMDGKYHRVPTTDDPPGKTAGSYRGFLDGIPSGHIRNFRSGYSEKWTSTSVARERNDSELAQVVAETRVAAHQRAVDNAASQNDVAKASAAKFEALSATPPQGGNGYLNRKQVEAFGVRFDGEKLVVPARDVEGKLWSLQTISEEGGAPKLFEKGGRMKATMHVIGEVQPGEPVLVAEGYATAASIHQATGKTVAIAFAAGNIEPVVEAIKGRYPDNPLYIMADNDGQKEQNVGLTKAIAAAEKHAVGVGLPQFTAAGKLTDFNDLQVAEGKTAVADQVSRTLFLTMAESRQLAIETDARQKQDLAVGRLNTIEAGGPELVQDAKPSRFAGPDLHVAALLRETDRQAQDVRRDPPPEAAPANVRAQAASAGTPAKRLEPLTNSEIPEPVRQRYLVSTVDAQPGVLGDAKTMYFFRDKENALAFADHGARMATEHSRPDVVESMIAVARTKGWESLRVAGAPEFRREVWLQASLQGLEVTGFKPQAADLGQLAALRTERAQNMLTSSPTAARDGPAPSLPPAEVAALKVGSSDLADLPRASQGFAQRIAQRTDELMTSYRSYQEGKIDAISERDRRVLAPAAMMAATLKAEGSSEELIAQRVPRLIGKLAALDVNGEPPITINMYDRQAPSVRASLQAEPTVERKERSLAR
jgi:antirestriction protein ArdC/phage/plasmid primase-like uncharacterized protein